MRTSLLALAVFFWWGSVAEAAMPNITVNPTNQTVAPGNNAILVIASPNATGYQWRFNGTDISWATNATLIVTNAQLSNSGYYMAVAKNDTGWTPSQMGYLSVVGGTLGVVPFSNTGNTNAQAFYQVFSCPPGWGYDVGISNGAAQLVAGPSLDAMKPVGTTRPVVGGYYGPVSLTRSVTTVAPGQDLYYRVDISYAIPCGGNTFVQPSTTLKIVAGGSSFPTPSVDAIRFPYYIEWPDLPWTYSPTNMHVVLGETVSLKFWFYSVLVGAQSPTNGVQWRKDGKDFGLPQSGTLTLTNITANDAGVYDIYASGGFNSYVSSKIFISVQTAGGQGQFKNPRKVNSSFVCDLDGAANRSYQILASTNLSNWSNLLVVTNVSGTVSFTNSMGSTRQYYRAMLLP